MCEFTTVIERTLTKNGEIQLQKRGRDYEIIFNGTFLMATYNGESEKLLVRSAIELNPLAKRILIGGLGVGFSLCEALKYDFIEKVIVVEIEPKIIEWYNTYFSSFMGNAKEDPRVKIINADLIEWMAKTQTKYDVICMDIDNGPEWTVLDRNKSLYSCEGIKQLMRLLDDYGTLSFWSASKSEQLESQLKAFFNNVAVYPVSHDSGKPDFVYTASAAKK
jgi:spermidine synthase